MLYGLLGLRFSSEATHISTHKPALDYFIFSFITDFGEIMKDYVAEERGKNRWAYAQSDDKDEDTSNDEPDEPEDESEPEEDDSEVEDDDEENDEYI